eukprot:CAMPEP_0184298982 /NCGR_PEP_ID=MMETSP1049-20130417/9672_1 /TAXON_ID=77928 /ORGANISM="Proteomonas sulcata, Strain CCMP704" /LENGTH=133 /DNA_ID=CAMNT_0026609285 /DNA_START=926 /DNA_END=1328 /DNA_ORIENTATION=-
MGLLMVLAEARGDLEGELSALSKSLLRPILGDSPHEDLDLEDGNPSFKACEFRLFLGLDLPAALLVRLDPSSSVWRTWAKGDEGLVLDPEEPNQPAGAPPAPPAAPHPIGFWGSCLFACLGTWAFPSCITQDL